MFEEEKRSEVTKGGKSRLEKGREKKERDEEVRIMKGRG